MGDSANAFMTEGQEYMMKTGLDVYLQQLVQTIVQSRPPNAAAHLELNCRSSVTFEREQEQLDACEKLLASFKLAVPKPELEEGEEEDPPAEEEPPADETEPNDGTFEDVIKTMSVMEVANIGLADQEQFMLHLSLKSLARKQPVERARFWGKIYGSAQDYYIAEAIMKDGSRDPPPAEEEEEPEEEGEDAVKVPKPPKIVWPPIEEPGGADEIIIKSPNQFVYYVTNSLTETWTRLPDVKPMHISAARTIKKIFTGSLEAPVFGCPPFPGKEQELLRAQIARISHRCFLAPRALFLLEGAEDGEEGTVVKNEEFKGINAAEMAPADSPSGWVHAYLDILPQGRCAFWQSASDEEAAAAAVAAAEEAGQPPPPPPAGSTHPKPLRNVHDDDEVVPGAPSWSTRTMCSHAPEYAKAVARSNAWPGACAVAFGTEYYNMYVGWGTKAAPREDSGHIVPVPGPTHAEIEIDLDEQDDLSLEPPKAETEEPGEE